jgi:hypothetical protein
VTKNPAATTKRQEYFIRSAPAPRRSPRR